MTALVVILAAVVVALLLLFLWERRRHRRTRRLLHLYQVGHQELRVGLNIWHLEDPNDPGSLRLVATNPAAAQATGVPASSVLGKRIDEGFPETVRRGVAQEFAEVALTGRPKHMGEVIYGDPRVTEGIYEVYCFPLPNRSVGVAFDNITRRRTVELQIERSATLIRMLAEVAVSANAADSADDVARTALEHVCRRAGWALGHMYWRPPGGDGLVPSGIWHPPDLDRYGRLREVTNTTRFRRGEGLPGRVLGNGAPDWTIDATMEGDTVRTAVLRELGLRAALAFPAWSGRDVVAVLEFFAPRAPIPDDELLNVMRQVGEVVGHAVGRFGAASAAERS